MATEIATMPLEAMPEVGECLIFCPDLSTARHQEGYDFLRHMKGRECWVTGIGSIKPNGEQRVQILFEREVTRSALLSELGRPLKTN